MTSKTYLVMGSNWVAEVVMSEGDNYDRKKVGIEVATRAVEALFQKRTDINIFPVHPQPEVSSDLEDITPTNPKEKSMVDAITKLMTSELVPGCGIGMLLGVIDATDPEHPDPENEWYISSRPILENAGCPNLVNAFNKKYPDTKKQTS